jgi:hypothetical protein
VHNNQFAPQWGFQAKLVLHLHHNGAFISEMGSRSVLRVCDDSPQMRAAKAFAPPWRIHGTEAAYLVPIDPGPSMSGLTISINL